MVTLFLLAVRYIPSRSPLPRQIWGHSEKYPALVSGLRPAQCAEHFALECFLYQFRNALVQVLSSVVLGYQDPGDRKIRVQTLLHLVDDLHKFGHSTHCQELSLNRDNQPIRGRQCVKREQRQRGGGSRSGYNRIFPFGP